MLSFNKKILLRFIWTFIIIGILAFLIFNQNGIIKFLSLRQELNNLNSQIKNAEDKINSLEMEIDSLNKSKEKIEKVAREKFHMMRTNERVLKVEEN